MTFLLGAVLALPLAAGATALIGGRRLAAGGGWLLASATAVSLLSLLAIGGLHPVGASPIFRAVPWLSVGGLELDLALMVDGLSWFVGLLVLTIALPVIVYSIGYLEDPTARPRFFAAMALFVSAMAGLVLAGSLVTLFIAWELVGVASWLLIGFRHRDDEPSRAALKAFLITRVADLGLLLGWIWLWLELGTTRLPDVFAAAGELPPATLTAIGFLVMAGALGKSAQLPFTAWLPSAMAGPTPVSALIHSATMVAAGVYLLLRLQPLYAAAPAPLQALAWIGAATALTGAVMALREMDLKRLLAWSTVSQLGEMMLAVSWGGPAAAALLLAAHAAYKACLFLAAGAIEHAAGTRDLRRLGGLGAAMPWTALAFVTATLALAGVPPLSGYWAEEALLANAAALHPGWAAYLIFLVLLAGIYTGRAATAVFLGAPGSKTAVHDPGKIWLAPLLAMAALAATAGVLASAVLPTLLPFSDRADHAAWPWRLVGTAAGPAGLTIGWLWTRGALDRSWLIAPARFLAAPLEAVAAGPALFARRTGVALNAFESVCDGSARFIAARSLQLGHRSRTTERLADGFGRWVAHASLAWAWSAAVIESTAFHRGGDRLAAGFGRGGTRLGNLQNGRLYLYTASVFGWILIAGLLAVVAGM